jgi:hypothetical protein
MPDREIKEGDQYSDNHCDSVVKHQLPFIIDGRSPGVMKYVNDRVPQYKHWPIGAMDKRKIDDRVYVHPVPCQELAFYPLHQHLYFDPPHLRLKAAFSVVEGYPGELTYTYLRIGKIFDIKIFDKHDFDITFAWPLSSITVPMYRTIAPSVGVISYEFHGQYTLSWSDPTPIRCHFDWDSFFTFDKTEACMQVFDSGATNNQYNFGIVPPGNPNNTPSGFTGCVNGRQWQFFNDFLQGAFGPVTYGPTIACSFIVAPATPLDVDYIQQFPVPPTAANFSTPPGSNFP